MKKYFCILILLIIPFATCLQITEVELNPLGTDKGFEWVEFFSEDLINLEGYRIVNYDDDEILLNGSFSGYFIYVFDKQWLDNSEEKIFLYKENTLIDETILFDDSKNNEFTWQFCSEWEFVSETKNDGCEKNEEKILEEEEEVKEKNKIDYEEIVKEDEEKIKESNNEIIDKEIALKNQVIEKKIEKKVMEPEMIRLNLREQKDIKTDSLTEELEENNYAIYGFAIFSVLIMFLFFFRRKYIYKNEFE